MAPRVSGAAFAPAKVNLYLHVGRPGADGFHPLSSWMAFADLGDRLTARPGAGQGLSLRIEGPFADGLAGEADLSDNLVLRAVRALAARAGIVPPDLALTLDKKLPIAAGLGGGSSDAGAALRLLRRALDLDLDDAALQAVAAGLGADGAVCLWGRPAIAQGRGEQLTPAPGTPPLPAVLVNPRLPCPTGAVYRAYDAAPHPEGAARPDLPARFDSLEAVFELLAGARNDLEPPAIRLVPEVGGVLDRLRRAPEARLARLSGSGATAFALCADVAAAEALAARLSREQPGWWVRACRLGGPWPDDTDA